MPVRPASEFDPDRMQELMKAAQEAQSDEEYKKAIDAANAYKLDFIPVGARGGADDELGVPNEPAGQPAG